MRKSSLFLIFLAGGIALLALMFIHASIRMKTEAASLQATSDIVGKLALSDLCLFTEASYTRHLSLADLHTPFQTVPSRWSTSLRIPGCAAGGHKEDQWKSGLSDRGISLISPCRRSSGEKGRTPPLSSSTRSSFFCSPRWFFRSVHETGVRSRPQRCARSDHPAHGGRPIRDDPLKHLEASGRSGASARQSRGSGGIITIPLSAPTTR